MKRRGGFTLVEMLIVMVLFSITSGLFAKSLLSKARKRADVEAVKSILDLASRRALIESKHFGINFDPSLKTASLFEDIAKDNIFNGTDTLTSLVKCNTLSGLAVVNESNVAATDICFKKNGAVSSNNSYLLTYVAPTGDTAKLQIIAASGRVLGP